MFILIYTVLIFNAGVFPKHDALELNNRTGCQAKGDWSRVMLERHFRLSSNSSPLGALFTFLYSGDYMNCLFTLPLVI